MNTILRVHLEVSYAKVHFDFESKPDALDFLTNLTTKKVFEGDEDKNYNPWLEIVTKEENDG